MVCSTTCKQLFLDGLDHGIYIKIPKLINGILLDPQLVHDLILARVPSSTTMSLRRHHKPQAT